MLIAHHRELIDQLRPATKGDPLRALVSGCLAGWSCGVDGTDYGMGGGMPELFDHPALKLLPFCPEQHALGTPRTMPDIHGGDGFDVLAGRARVLDEHGTDLTAQMIEGAMAMRDFAREADAEIALLTDMSAACGSQVISDACRLVDDQRYRWGVGVATAALLQDSILVVSQRDLSTLARLRSHLDQAPAIETGLRDHHDHPWTREHLPGPHPRAEFGVDGVLQDPGPYENTFLEP